MGLANYTPILLSQIPAMSCRRLDRADIAPRLGHHRPTANGYVARNWRGHSQGDGGSPILFGDMFIFKAIAIYLRGSGSLRFKGALENSRLHLNRLPILQDHLRQRSSYSRSQAAVFFFRFDPVFFRIAGRFLRARTWRIPEIREAMAKNTNTFTKWNFPSGSVMAPSSRPMKGERNKPD